MSKYEKVMSSSLIELVDLLSNEEGLEMFAIDFHPWDGLIEYSILTKDEVEEDPLLKDLEEMAAWKLFHVSSQSNVWKDEVLQIAETIKANYEKAQDKELMVEAEYKDIVSALKSESVKSSFAKLNLTESFQISVVDLDSGEEYYA